MYIYIYIFIYKLHKIKDHITLKQLKKQIRSYNNGQKKRQEIKEQFFFKEVMNQPQIKEKNILIF